MAAGGRRITLMRVLGLAWSAVIGADCIGLDSGMSRIIIYARCFRNTGRMTLATLLIILYASISFLLFKRLARILSWMPGPAFATGTASREWDHPFDDARVARRLGRAAPANWL